MSLTGERLKLVKWAVFRGPIYSVGNGWRGKGAGRRFNRRVADDMLRDGLVEKRHTDKGIPYLVATAAGHDKVKPGKEKAA